MTLSRLAKNGMVWRCDIKRMRKLTFVHLSVNPNVCIIHEVTTYSADIAIFLVGMPESSPLILSELGLLNYPVTQAYEDLPIYNITWREKDGKREIEREEQKVREEERERERERDEESL